MFSGLGGKVLGDREDSARSSTFRPSWRVIHFRWGVLVAEADGRTGPGSSPTGGCR
ncbi:unnamed protein product, partial [Polarella glacialis]